MDHVSISFDVPMDPVTSFKDYAIRRLRGRIRYKRVSALRDVDLHVLRGHTAGIIGRNGAGKSTLLRVIARVLRPTSGRIRVWGSIAPLIELGAGFHPDLSGRENVFLNGALLGRSTRDIRERMEMITNFAELGDFIDAPIRTYSSGMTARLGFAVATAWEADVLLVDEVLAVGDEAFRRKCAARIAELRKGMTSIVIVSHDLTLMRSMCDQVVWLDNGAIRMQGAPSAVTAAYHAVST